MGYGVDIATHGQKIRGLGYSTNEGDLIPVEIVDEIEKDVISNLKRSVLNKTAGLNLTQYQIYALMSRCYNYGVSGGLERATDSFIYPSEETFVSAYNKYYKDVKNEEFYGDYTKTNFSNKLYENYMTWLNYTSNGKHPEGWEYRRKSEWSLFQTGYFGYDIKNGTGHGIDEYCNTGTGTTGATEITNNINLYNSDGSVNQSSIEQLEKWLTQDLLNTTIHNGTYARQGGPFAKWWDSANNWFTSAGYKFQCTWYVYGRANQFLEANGTKYKMWPGTKDSARHWYSSGEGFFECGKEPKQNSIAVWGNGSYGHVAYVEAVDYVNGKVYISHAGGGRSWYGIGVYGMEEMKSLWGYNLLGYVYLDKPK